MVKLYAFRINQHKEQTSVLGDSVFDPEMDEEDDESEEVKEIESNFAGLHAKSVVRLRKAKHFRTK